jgi:hypothetical protein
MASMYVLNASRESFGSFEMVVFLHTLMATGHL